MVTMTSAYALAGPAGAAHAEMSPVTARPASVFHDSFGVGIHSMYPDTSYGDLDRLVRLVDELGVKHVREGIVLNREGDAYPTLQRLSARGVKAMLLFGREGEAGMGTVQQQLAVLRGPLAGTFDAFEGPNETDCSGDPAWLERLHSRMQELRSALEADPELSRVPLAAPSFCTYEGQTAFADLPGVGDLVDLGTTHDYAGGSAPERGVANAQSLAARISGTKPVIASEFGFHNATASQDPWQRGISEQAAATYAVRQFLEHFRLGMPRSYLYELLDEKPEAARTDMEQHWGLVRVDGTPKPAYHALRALLDVVDDGAPSGEQAQLAYQLVGAPSDVRQVLLSRKDGSFDLVLWRAASVYEHGTGQDVAVPDVPVTVQLGQGAAVQAFRPVSGSAAGTALGSGTSFQVRLAGDPVVLRVSSDSPAAVTTAPPASSATPDAAPAPAVRPGTYGDVVAASGAVAHYRFDAGDPLRSALLDGQALRLGTGSASPTTTVGAVTGDATGALVQQAGGTTLVAPLLETLDRWTLESWVRYDGGSASSTWFAAPGTSWAGQLRLYQPGAAPGPALSAYGGAATPGAAGAEIFADADADTWHHVALTNDGQSSVLYVDGAEQARAASVSTPLRSLAVGAPYGGAWSGALDEVAVYPHALDAARLQQHHAAGRGQLPFMPVPVAAPRTSTDPAAMPATALSLAASQPRVLSGAPVALRGSLTTATGGPLAGQVVELLARTSGTATAVPVARTTTDPSGGYAFSRALTVNTDFSTRYGGSTTAAPATSAVVRVLCRVRVSAAASAAQVAVGRSAFVRGRVAVAPAGARVALERRTNGVWRSVAVTTVGADGSYAFALRPGSRAVLVLRVTRPTDALRLGASSPAVALRVV